MDYKNIFLKVIKIGIILILFTPLVLGPFGLSLSNYPKTVFFRSLIEIIFIFYLILIFFDSKYLPKISPLVLVVSTFGGILLLTSLTGINFHRSFWGDLFRVEGVILHLHLLVFFLILISIFQEKKEWLLLFKLTVIVSAISSLAGVLQRIGVASFYGLDLPSRISGTWTNPDFFAPYIVLTIFLAVFLIAAEREKNWKIIWSAILLLNCLTLILSKTRAAWVGLAVGMIFLFSFWFFSYAKLNQKKRRLILLGILVLSIFLLLMIVNQDRIFLSESHFFQRAISVFNPGALASRLPVWEIAFEAWKEKPILGWGAESFSFVFDKYFKADYLQHISEKIHFDRPHNKVLGLMATTGILGLLSYLSMFFVIFYLLFKKIIISKNKKNSNPSPLAKNEEPNPIFGFILVALFVAYFIQNLACFDTVGTYLIFFLVLGFINNNFSSWQLKFWHRDKPLPPDTKKKLLKIVLIIPLIFLSLTVFYRVNFKPTIACRTFFRALEMEKKDFGKALLEYQEGASKNTIFDKDFRIELASRLIFILENFKPSKNAEAEIVKILSDLKPFLEKELEKPDRRYLDSYELIARINERIYLFSGDLEALEETEEVSIMALSFNDQKPEFYRLIGKTKIYQKNYSEGEAFFEKAFELAPRKLQDRVKFYRVLGVVYFKAGDNLMAVENFKKALEIELSFKKFIELSPEEIQETLNTAKGVAHIYYQEFNDLETCRQIYERAMEVFPDHKEELQFNLEALLKQ